MMPASVSQGANAAANKRRRHCATPMMVMGLIFAAAATYSPSAGADFSDDFEADQLNPFWSVFAKSGSVALSTERVHGGKQAVRFTTVNSGQNKELQLYHEFDHAIYGTVSTWVFDSGADQPSSNYITLYVVNHDVQSSPSVGARDYDLGKGNGGEYDYSDWSGGAYSAIDRTQAWHHWEITSQPNRFAVAIDGTTVFSASSGKPFNTVVLTMHAPSWRPAWVADFDDFSLVEFILGDMNCDQVVDFDDIDPFVLALTSRRRYEEQYPDCQYLRADINADGVVDFDDIDPFVALLSGG